MSYRNPGIIRDRTADVYVQASKDLTNVFIKGFESKGARLAAEAKEKDAYDGRWRLNANRNSKVQQDENRTTGDLVNAINGDLYTDFQTNTEILGNPALNANTDNQTNTNLTTEQRNDNTRINTKYETYNTTSQNLMGLIKSELNEHYGEKNGSGGLSNMAYGKDWNYVGNNEGERVANMFIVNSLNNTDAASTYGGTMSKSGGYDKKGNSNATFETRIPSDNKEFLAFQPLFNRGEMGDKEWTLHKEKNGIVEEVDSETNKSTFIFRRVINNENFGKGFVAQTMAGPSAEDMLENPGMIVDGKVPNAAFITDKLNSQVANVSGEKGGRATTKSNTKRFMSNAYYVGSGAKNWQTALSKAKAVIGLNDTEEIDNYLKNRISITSPEKVMINGLYDADLIAEAMQMQTQRDALSERYGNKKATPEDVTYYKNQGMTIDEGDVIYYEESNPSETYNKTNATYTKTQVFNSTKVNNNWTKSQPVLKKIFKSLTTGAKVQPSVKTLMADFAEANISAMPIYGEDDKLVGYELKNQLVTTKPATILVNESPESIDQAIKVASGLSFSIETQWKSLQPDPIEFDGTN
mgnify:CR=1 FL=1